MRVAVQIFGHLRTFERCAESLRCHLLDRYPEHDVFLHTWDRLESETLTHHAPLCEPAPVDERVAAAIESAYRPRRMTIEPQTPRAMGNLSFSNGKRIDISGIWHMFASMQRANALRERHTAETGAQYDVAVAVRPDIALYRPLDLDLFFSYSRPPTVPEDETAFTRFAAFGPVPLILNDLRGLPATDLLFFARPDVMTRVVSIADAGDRYDMAAAVAPTRPRHLMNTFCSDIGITTAVIDYIRPRDFDIVRAA
jgi:hypothetical protein